MRYGEVNLDAYAQRLRSDKKLRSSWNKFRDLYARIYNAYAEYYSVRSICDELRAIRNTMTNYIPQPTNIAVAMRSDTAAASQLPASMFR